MNRLDLLEDQNKMLRQDLELKTSEMKLENDKKLQRSKEYEIKGNSSRILIVIFY